jgi:hypothetical protein
MTRLGPVLGGAMLALGAAGATSLACQVDTTARLTNARLRGGSRDDSIRSIERYIRSIRDSEFVTGTGAVDEQRLRTCRSRPCRYGPLAVIQPRVRITDSGSTTLVEGEVIARLINKSDTGYIYSISGRDTSYKFNLHARDTVYWWVGKRDTLVSVFYSKRTRRMIVSDLTPDLHERGYWKQPIARWIWDETDEKGWGTCDGGVCCLSTGIASVLGK